MINQYAGSPSMGMDLRPHWLATEWQRIGHEVLVVAGDHSHLRRRHPEPGHSTIDGVDFFTLATPNYQENGPRRLVNMVAFRFQLRWHSGMLSSWRPDAVIASSTHPLDVRPSLRIARQAGAVLVHEVHDLWPLTPRLLAGLSEKHPMIVWMQREEDLACRDADLVASILPGTQTYLQSRGLDPNRWVHISNGVPTSAVAHMPRLGRSSSDPFRIGYFGGHGPSNDLETLIAAAQLLADTDIEFHLTGSGPSKPLLQAMSRGLGHVRFHDAVTPEEARPLMRTMDGLYMGLHASPLYEHGIGLNKMFDYMAAGVPIIQAIETPASPAEDAGCAMVCKPGDPHDVARAITGLRSASLERRATLATRGLDYVRDHATYPRLAEAFLQALEEACERRAFQGSDS